MGVVEFLKYLAKKIGRLLGREPTVNRIETRRKTPPPAPQIQPPPKTQPEIILPPVETLEVYSTDDWNAQVRKMSQELIILAEFLRREEKTINSRQELKKYADTVKIKLDKMKAHIGEKFPEPLDIDETTTEKLAGKIIKFVENYVLELFSSSYNGLNYTKGGELERQFYKNFRAQLELYLARIGVDRDEIKAGASFKNYRELFDLKPYDAIQTDDDSKDGLIAEIEFLPHFVPYRSDEGNERRYLPGKCKIFKARR